MSREFGLSDRLAVERVFAIGYGQQRLLSDLRFDPIGDAGMMLTCRYPLKVGL
jgi:hypothetical protein